MTIRGDIKINGKEYRVDLATWREKDIIDFAPRASVPGGSVVMSDLNLYQPLVQTDWRHGFGFHWNDDGSGYMSTVGSIDTRQDGIAMLYTKAVASETGQAKSGYVNFNGALYSWGTSGLRKYTGGVWSSIFGSPVNYAINAGDYLFFTPDGTRIKKMDLSGTVTDAGLDSSSVDFSWLIIHNGYIFAGKKGTNQIHYDSNPDLSQLEGTTSDPDTIYCGIGNMETTKAVVFAGSMYVARADGLWIVGEDRIARRVLDYTNEISTENFRTMAVVNGFLVFSIRDRIIQWNGARVADITPPKITDTFPYLTYGRFSNFVAADNFLYCIGRTNETSYDEALLCWDGVGWHKLTDILTDASAEFVSALGFDTTNFAIWYNRSGVATPSDFYISQQQRSAFPFANFPTTGTHSIISSRLDMGFRRVKKSAPSLLVEARNVTSLRYIRVYYQLDGDGTWVLWDDVKTNGIIELKFPGGMPTREFNYLLLRFDFITDSSDQSPIMEGYTLRFIMRPDVKLGFNFWIVVATNFQDSTLEDERTAVAIREELLLFRDSKAPVELVDVLGNKYNGYITSIQGVPAQRTVYEDGELPDIEWKYQVNFVTM